MRRLLVISAIALAGCQAGTTHGFEVNPPAGWKDATDEAEIKSGEEFEIVYEGPTVQGVPGVIAIVRKEIEDDERGVTAQSAAERRRRDVIAAIAGARPTAPTPATIAGEPARIFDYSAEASRIRTVAAVHGAHTWAVTLEAHPDAFEMHTRVLDELLRSWRWE